MAKIFQYKYQLTLALLTIIVFLGLFCNIPNSNAQGQEFAVTLPNQYPILEYTDNFGQNVNTKTANIPLPTDQWNITDIELNFTDIKLDHELKVIEDRDYNYRIIDKGASGHPAYAVQMNITETTTIFQAQIFAQRIVPAIATITIQIRGCDDITNKPNSTIYASTVLNISNSLMWYIQNFSSPVRLTKGYYYLVFNGIDMPLSDPGIYYWYYNSIDSNNTNLYTWYYVRNPTPQWNGGIPGQPLLYKLVQRVNRSYNPEDINMTINLNDLDYPILNGTKAGAGKVNISDINLNPHLDLLSLMVQNSQSLDLYYNISFYAKYKNSFLSSGQVLIEEGSNIIWQINPQINRVFNNYSIKFIYSKSWFNLTVERNGVNITEDIIFSENSLKILDTSILPGSTWLITANSSNISFELYFPVTSWKIGQELEFSLQQPVIPGTYTFKLYNSLGEKYNFTKEIPAEDNSFSYEIPSNTIEGDYTAFVLFNNGTDAGIASQEFEIIAAPSGSGPEFPIFFIVLIIIISVAVALGISSYVVYKRYKTSYRRKMKNILNEILDVMNLEYVIVLDVKSGIDIFSLSFGEKEVDATLISGFLHALRNFGTEVIEGIKDSRTVKVEYKKSIILMTEFVNLRLIMIMSENPSKNFIYSIESLAYDIYKNYGKQLDHFHGNLKEFRGIKELVEKNLNLSIKYPLTIVQSENVKLTFSEKAMVERAETFMENHDFNYFYVIYLMPENIFTPKDAKTILSLINKKVFRPLENTIEK
jgi:hypothetical protein